MAADDDPGMQLVHRLRAATVRFNLAGARFAAENGLHPTDLRALIALLDAERAGIAATPGWLGEQLGINSASVTALVDRLQRLGHVGRDRDPADRRRVQLTVTDGARELGWAFFGPIIDRLLDTVHTFDEREFAAVRTFLDAASAIAATDLAEPHGPPR